MARGRSLRCRGVVMALAMTAAGCSSDLPKTASVQGKVILKKGEPLANATVQFIPVSETDGFIANGTTDGNGAFQLQTYVGVKRVKLDGAVPGKYKVVVTPYPHSKRISPNYASPIDTPLTVEVLETGNANLTLDVSN